MIDTYQDEIGAETNGEGPDDGYDPMHPMVYRPAVNEQAQRHARTEPYHEQKAVFRFGFIHAIGFHARCLDPGVQGAENGYAED